MAVTFQPAEEVAQIAGELIPAYHGHLLEARVGYLFRVADQEWTAGAKAVWGRAYKVPARERHYSGLDFVIVVDRATWFGLSSERRRALVDHELAHLGQDHDRDGNPRWVLWPHDVEDFAAVIERHGLWHRDVRRFAEVAAAKLQQLSFDDLAVEVGAPAGPTVAPALEHVEATAGR